LPLDERCELYPPDAGLDHFASATSNAVFFTRSCATSPAARETRLLVFKIEFWSTSSVTRAEAPSSSKAASTVAFALEAPFKIKRSAAVAQSFLGASGPSSSEAFLSALACCGEFKA
jgi:hypothetical protein